MKKILEFIERIQNEKKEIFKNENDKFGYPSTKDVDSDKFGFKDKSDVFFYFSEDKKILTIGYGEYDPRQVYSYLIYFNFYYHVAEYTNGGLKLIGFYDRNNVKVQEIPIGTFKIFGCVTGCNFDEIRKPKVSFELKDNLGNKYRSIRGDAYVPYTCQRAVDSIWELEKFHNDFNERVMRSPKY